jgi:hypothetical protein
MCLQLDLLMVESDDNDLHEENGELVKTAFINNTHYPPAVEHALSWITSQATQRQISRRGVLRGTAVGALGVAGGLLLGVWERNKSKSPEKEPPETLFDRLIRWYLTPNKKIEILDGVFTILPEAKRLAWIDARNTDSRQDILYPLPPLGTADLPSPVPTLTEKVIRPMLIMSAFGQMWLTYQSDALQRIIVVETTDVTNKSSIIEDDNKGLLQIDAGGSSKAHPTLATVAPETVLPRPSFGRNRIYCEGTLGPLAIMTGQTLRPA